CFRHSSGEWLLHGRRLGSCLGVSPANRVSARHLWTSRGRLGSRDGLGWHAASTATRRKIKGAGDVCCRRKGSRARGVASGAREWHRRRSRRGSDPKAGSRGESLKNSGVCTNQGRKSTTKETKEDLN